MTTQTNTLTPPAGAPKSSPTATAAGTGNGASAAPNASPATAAHSATSTTRDRPNTGSASARKRKPPPTRDEVLQIWQQATLNLRLAGFDLTVHALEDKDALVLVLADVRLHAGQFILAK